MWRTSCVFVGLGLVFAFAGCGGSGSGKSGTGGTGGVSGYGGGSGYGGTGGSGGTGGTAGTSGTGGQGGTGGSSGSGGQGGSAGTSGSGGQGGSAGQGGGAGTGGSAGQDGGAGSGGTAGSAGQGGGAGTGGTGGSAGQDSGTDPCQGYTCNSPPADACNGDTLMQYASSGTCSAPDGGPVCAYAPTQTDCTQSSQECIAQACRTPVTIGFCRTQYPDMIADVATGADTVYGRVYVSGITDQTVMTDPDPRIVAQVGYGGTGTQPDTWTNWTDAVPNTAYDGTSAGEPNNDEYMADLPIPPTPGQIFDYEYRFSGDGGRTWTYCETGNAGTSGPGTMNVEGPYFSEYVEGSASNKAVEIANPGSSAFDVSSCQLEVYYNGNSTSTNIDLSSVGTIASGDVLVVCNVNYALSDSTECDINTGSANWSGNDAIALTCNGVVYDVFGQIGYDPGNAWGSGSTTTLDNTLLRTCGTTVGDLDGSNAFDPAAEWTGYGTDVTYLGSVNCPLP